MEVEGDLTVHQIDVVFDKLLEGLAAGIAASQATG